MSFSEKSDNNYLKENDICYSLLSLDSPRDDDLKLVPGI